MAKASGLTRANRSGYWGDITYFNSRISELKKQEDDMQKRSAQIENDILSAEYENYRKGGGTYPLGGKAAWTEKYYADNKETVDKTVHSRVYKEYRTSIEIVHNTLELNQKKRQGVIIEERTLQVYKEKNRQGLEWQFGKEIANKIMGAKTQKEVRAIIRPVISKQLKIQ